MKTGLKKIQSEKKILYLLLAGLAVFVGINAFVKYTSDKRCYRNVADVPACDVAIVLGAGVHGDVPSKYLADRLDAAVTLYKNNKVQKLLLTGDHGRVDYNELVVMKLHCFRKGVDTTRIYLDYAGFDTYSSLYRAKHIFNVGKAILVSQNYHLDRAVFIGNRLGVECYGFAADKGRYTNYKSNVIREYPAVIKSVLDLSVKRKPKYLGDRVDISGESNYTHK